MSKQIVHPLKLSCNQCNFGMTLDCSDPHVVNKFECPDCESIIEL